jgi:hypothetical protein
MHLQGELRVVYPSSSPLCPQCSLWLFSVFSVLNSEKRNTEDTKNHREIGLGLSLEQLWRVAHPFATAR